MFKLIDYKETESADGYTVLIDYFYKVRNINTNEERWVDRYEYDNIKRQGFLVKQ